MVLKFSVTIHWSLLHILEKIRLKVISGQVNRSLWVTSPTEKFERGPLQQFYAMNMKLMEYDKNVINYKMFISDFSYLWHKVK